jgi:hypothetical protein
LQLADDDSTSTLSLEKKREKMKTLAAAGLFILRVCWSGHVAGKFCGAVGMPSSRGSLDRACVGVGRGSPRPTSGSARYSLHDSLLMFMMIGTTHTRSLITGDI